MAEENKGKKCNCGIGVGIIIIAVGILADSIGLGSGLPGYGIKQIAVIALGVVILLCGLLAGSSFCRCPKK